jgi:hypothetical protein
VRPAAVAAAVPLVAAVDVVDVAPLSAAVRPLAVATVGMLSLPLGMPGLMTRVEVGRRTSPAVPLGGTPLMPRGPPGAILHWILTNLLPGTVSVRCGPNLVAGEDGGHMGAVRLRSGVGRTPYDFLLASQGLGCAGGELGCSRRLGPAPDAVI